MPSNYRILQGMFWIVNVLIKRSLFINEWLCSKVRFGDCYTRPFSYHVKTVD